MLWTMAGPRGCKAQRLRWVRGQPPAAVGRALGLMALHAQMPQPLACEAGTVRPAIPSLEDLNPYPPPLASEVRDTVLVRSRPWRGWEDLGGRGTLTSPTLLPGRGTLG